MQITKKETNNPRARKPIKYDVTGLTAAEFETLCRALALIKEEPTAAALYSSFANLAGLETCYYCTAGHSYDDCPLNGAPDNGIRQEMAADNCKQYEPSDSVIDGVIHFNDICKHLREV